MRAHRRPEIRFSDAPRGTCRWCGEQIVYESGPRQGLIDRRRRWHPACVDDYTRSDPREARRLVRRRDRGVCADCGLDTYALRRRHRGRGSTRKLRGLGFKPRKSLWELDHIVPLIDGGSHDPTNLQTLCTPCHKRKTAGEARARRDVRRQSEAEALLESAEQLLARSERLVALLEEGGPVAGEGLAESRTDPSPTR